ncbi:MAG: translation initiation factor eIF-2B [Dehalococcoidales bacterium]|nr:translation initiation factor eIF-2B [Dehalococcoidales bacterium]
MDISPEIIGLIDAIRNDKTRGASELARQSIEVLKLAAKHSRTSSTAEFLMEQQDIGGRLMSARPAMAPIFNLVSRLLDTVTEKAAADMDSIRRLTTSKADELVRDSLQAIAQIAKYSSQLVAGGDKIMTHSYSSTVIAALKAVFNEHSDIEVVITRSGAGHTGENTARQLGSHGIPLTFIDDTAVGLYLPTVNKVMVGADRVCADGKIVNGVGTYLLALAAEKAEIPVYILCDTLKFDPRLRSNEIDLEEKEPSEVIEPGRLPPQVTIRNPYFDITPLELVTGIITENGLMKPAEVIRYLRGKPAKES